MIYLSETKHNNMRTLLIITLSSILFASCQNNVGRYTYHVTADGNEGYAYFDKEVFDTKTGVSYSISERAYNGTKSGGGTYLVSTKTDWTTGETTYKVGGANHEDKIEMIKEFLKKTDWNGEPSAY